MFFSLVIYVFMVCVGLLTLLFMLINCFKDVTVLNTVLYKEYDFLPVSDVKENILQSGKMKFSDRNTIDLLTIH